MVGICGVLGDGEELRGEVVERITWRSDEVMSSFSEGGVQLTLSSHPRLTDDQPVFVDGEDVVMWAWGDVYGHGTGDEYVPRTGPPDGSATYCARLYEERGLGFVSELNGDFALAVYDRSENTFSFLTDRVSSRPVFYTQQADDALVFASNLQAMPHFESVRPEFDLPYLQEYLGLRRVFGVETPLADVREFPPASVVKVDLDDLTTERTTYWTPRYDPVDRPASHFVDEIVDILRRIFAEWTHDDLDYGLLLSGGRDSRLVEACIDQPVVAFHNADWMSREARIARRVAETAGDEFRFLRREDDHEERTLETAPLLSDFSGWFDQAYFTEFEEEIRDQVDVVVSGMFADMLFRDGALRTKRQSLGPLGMVSLPLKRCVENVDDYIDAKLAESKPLPYFRSSSTLREVLNENVRSTADGVVSHGVHYESLTDLEMYGDYYPLGADTEAIFPRSLLQIRPYRTPFLDNRLLDLQQRIPHKYLLRRNLISAGVKKSAPSLAEIPHATSGVPLKYSFPIEYVGRNATGFYRKHVREDPVPAPHLDHDPWPDRAELLRTYSFGIDTIRENSEVFEDFPFLDYSGAERAVQAHLNGEENHTVLYSLLTFLEMPLTEIVRQSRRKGDRSTAWPVETEHWTTHRRRNQPPRESVDDVLESGRS